MSLERLDGVKTSRGHLRLQNVRRGRFREEQDALVVLAETEEVAIRLKHFSGRPSAGIPPWIEASVLREEPLRRELILALADLLPLAGRLMITYGDDETERGLKRRFPPVVTPIGRDLFAAGCTWFKDWYYPEGWLEGEFKLQGNKPASAEAREANLDCIRAEVEAWLAQAPMADDQVFARARERALALLEALEQPD